MSKLVLSHFILSPGDKNKMSLFNPKQTWAVTTLGLPNCRESWVFLAFPVWYQSQCCLRKLSHRLVLRRWDQLSQLTGHNLHPTYLRVTSNVTEKYEKYLWYWYPMTQLSSQSCLQHQESIPHLFLTGVLWALKFELLWSNFKKGVTTMLWKFFLSIPGSSGQSLKFSHVNPGLVRSMWINLFLNPRFVKSYWINLPVNPGLIRPQSNGKPIT